MNSLGISMRMWIVSLAFAIVLSGLPSLVMAEETTENTLKAGAAELKITSSRDPKRVHDDLYARTLVVSDNDKSIVVITLDLGGMSPDATLKMRQTIEKATGIPEQNIVINCSHTHNAPWGDESNWEDGLSYFDWMCREMAAITKQAKDSAQPAVLRYGREPVQIGFNRRVKLGNGRITMAPNPHGAIVPWVDVLTVYSTDKKRIGILFSHAAHPVIIHESSKLIGADFPGAAVKTLQGWLWKGGKQDGVIMFAQGCCGNINGYPLRGGYQACEVAGRTLAQAVIRARYEDIAPGKVKVRSRQLALPFQDPPSVEECKQLIERNPKDKRYARLLKMAEAGDPKPMPFGIRAMAVGDDLCILSLPYEMFAEYQLFAVGTSPFKHTFVFGYTNGTGAYVATKEDYLMGMLGGYESSPLGNAFGGMYGLP